MCWHAIELHEIWVKFERLFFCFRLTSLSRGNSELALTGAHIAYLQFLSTDRKVQSTNFRLFFYFLFLVLDSSVHLVIILKLFISIMRFLFN